MPTWKEITTANPEHSHNYARRWRTMVAQGEDIDGEARLIDALVPRESSILDAGCGTGRLGGYLQARGHNAYGVDIDPILIEHARHDFPTAHWEVGDLSEDALPVEEFDLAVSAGNVMGFIDPEGREAALANIIRSLKVGGRLVVGFGAGRGWDFEDFLATAEQVGFTQEHLFESWDLNPFTQDSGFLVAFLRK